MKKRLQNSYERYDPGIVVTDDPWEGIPQVLKNVHSFVAEVATKLTTYDNMDYSQAIVGAVVVQGIADDLKKNMRVGISSRMDITWVYSSISDMIEKKYSYMHPSQLTRILNKLAENGTIKRGVFDSKGLDRTYWYTIWDNEIRAFCGLPSLIFHKVHTEDC